MEICDGKPDTIIVTDQIRNTIAFQARFPFPRFSRQRLTKVQTV